MKSILLTACIMLNGYFIVYAGEFELDKNEIDTSIVRVASVKVISNQKTTSSKAELMNCRLKRYGIRSNVKNEDLKNLNVHLAFQDEYYNEFMFANPCRNADTARNFNWLTEDEKDTYYWLNYVRLNPKKFCDEFILPIAYKLDSNPYVMSLVDYLYNMKPMCALVPDRQFYDLALCHAVSSGKVGYVGHDRFGDCGNPFSECCSYGNSSALEHIIDLLIDWDISCLGHRYICLGYFNKAGIAYAAHSVYIDNVVLVFDVYK